MNGGDVFLQIAIASWEQKNQEGGIEQSFRHAKQNSVRFWENLMKYSLGLFSKTLTYVAGFCGLLFVLEDLQTNVLKVVIRMQTLCVERSFTYTSIT